MPYIHKLRTCHCLARQSASGTVSSTDSCAAIRSVHLAFRDGLSDRDRSWTFGENRADADNRCSFHIFSDLSRKRLPRMGVFSAASASHPTIGHGTFSYTLPAMRSFLQKLLRSSMT